MTDERDPLPDSSVTDQPVDPNEDDGENEPEPDNDIVEDDQ